MPAANKPSLDTLGEIFRFAVRRFRAARLAYGHGTTNARDEAAFLVLEALRLPIDRLEPYLDLKPTAAERARLLTLIDARVSLRLPAPYLVGAAYMHGVRFHADRRALIPRSFIGDMLADGVLPIGDPRAGPARARSLHRLGLPRHPGGARLPARAHRCRRSVGRRAGAGAAQRGRRIGWAIASRSIAAISSRRSAGQRYDLILSNPPYVDARGMARLPPEYRHEPRLALAAGDDGLDLVRRILARGAATPDARTARCSARSAAAARRSKRRSRACPSSGSTPSRARARYSGSRARI